MRFAQNIYNIFLFISQAKSKSIKLLACSLLLILTSCGGGEESVDTTLPDTIAPVITLNGDSSIELLQGEIYKELGASANDDMDGEVEVIITGPVDISKLGTYTITYTATDSAGNDSSVTRTITVIQPADTTAPVITLNGDSSVVLFQDEIYKELGAIANDDKDGEVEVIITGAVDTSELGTYTITYTATDSAGNASSVTRTITVVQPTDTPPVITLNGNSSIVLLQDAFYNELGASANDDEDGEVEVIITGAVDTSELGTYTITYTATDSAGSASSVTRTITVIAEDITPPVITLNGFSSSLFLNENYIEQGAHATDDIDGVVGVTISGAVDTDKLGTYSITYSATDAAGNRNSITRFIVVINPGPKPFITTWKTDNEGYSSSNQIMIETDGTGYEFNISWGDGTFNENVTGDITHTYEVEGVYAISINGRFPKPHFTPFIEGGWDYGMTLLSDSPKLLSIVQWGDIEWRTMNHAFSFCRNLVGEAGDAPNLSMVSDLSYMFSRAFVFNQDISNWDVSKITNMSHMFEYSYSFNQNISNWDVSSVTNMSGMFSETEAFNQDLSSWNVSNVKNMEYMFLRTPTLNSPDVFNQDLSDWDVSNVRSMRGMFLGTDVFNQDLSSWDVSSVTDMGQMFSDTEAFNQDLSSWDVSSVTNMAHMFIWAEAFNQNVGSWDVSNVDNMNGMFAEVTLSTENYDALLLGWSNLHLKKNLNFHGGYSQYSASSQSARDVLTESYGWTITDGGIDD